jgi:hypothetical protein
MLKQSSDEVVLLAASFLGLEPEPERASLKPWMRRSAGQFFIVQNSQVWKCDSANGKTRGYILPRQN